jgi:putative ABC transport system permease protein
LFRVHAARAQLGGGEVILQQRFRAFGVVANRPENVVAERVIRPLPVAADFARPPAGGMTIMARSDAGPDALSGIRNEIASIDPNLSIFNVQTLSDYLDRSRSSTRFSVQTYGGIGVFGLVLAAIGLAGITGYAVAQRRKEIAIRTALGASRSQVLRLVLREGTALVSVGTVLGFLGAMAMAKILSALTNIFVEALRIGTDDPRLLIGAPALLAAVTMLACYVPARRSARIDPLTALREE